MAVGAESAHVLVCFHGKTATGTIIRRLEHAVYQGMRMRAGKQKTFRGRLTYLWCRVDGKLELALAAVVAAQLVEQVAREAGAGAAAEGAEQEEALDAGSLLGHAPHPVQHQVYHLGTHSVVAAREVTGGVLLATDQLLGVEQLTVRARADLICNNFLDNTWSSLLLIS